MVYNYTIPRRPIAAMYSSPGPCYGLPGLLGQSNHDPRNVHTRAPGYYMGKRLPLDPKSNSPGPKYFPNPKYLRNGLDNPPAYSHAFRHPEPKKDKLPGPADYAPETYRPDIPPKYTFGVKHRMHKNDDNPGPNQYVLPLMTGDRIVQGDKKSSPAFTMVSRTKQKTYNASPGPARYQTGRVSLYKTQEPSYSMGLRTKPPKERGTKPGPGAHDNATQWGSRKAAPKFTFGLKHSNYVSSLIVEQDFE